MKGANPADAKILVVDDEAANRKLLKTLLEHEGYQTIQAANGKEALEILEREEIALVLLDLMMPELDGFQVLNILEERGSLPGISVILLTALSERKIRIKALESGAVDFLTKPFDHSELLCRVRTLVELARLRKVTLAKVHREAEIEVVSRVQQALEGLPIFVHGAKLERGSFRTQWVAGDLTKLLGVERDQYISQDWRDFIHPDDQPKAAMLAEPRGSEPDRRWEFQYRWNHPERGDRWFLSVGRLHFEDDHVYGAHLDITDAKELEFRYLQAQKMEAVGQLAGGIAHDFNNLLSVILSFTNFAKSTLEEDSPAHDDLEEVTKAGERAAGLTRQLLTFSRRQPTIKEPTDLNDRLAQLNRLLIRSVGEHIRLELNPSVHRAVVLIDPVQFDQIVLNLAVNARDAMPEGGTLKISLDKNADGYVTLQVRDNGTGMAPDTQKRIFEPFYTTKNKGSGTGLGLATVKVIVEKSGGTIAVDSELGKGTTFTIRIPESSESSVSQSTQAELRDGTGYQILVVEDEVPLLRALSRTLKKAGYQVHTATDWRQAYSKLKILGPELQGLVTDLILPGGTGLKLADYAQKVSPDIGVVLTTGYFDKSLEVEQTRFDLLWKPVHPTDLLKTLGNVLGRQHRPAPLKKPAKPPAITPSGNLIGQEVALSNLRNKLLAAHNGGDVFFKNADRTEQLFASALEKLHVVYQPLVRSEDNSVFGFEAFLRCDHPEFQSPLRLFAAAETLGKVEELGRAARAVVAKDLFNYRERLEVIFVNLHPSELRSRILCDFAEPLQQYASRVVLEVTEMASINAGAKTKEEIRKLKELGFRMAVDDIGEGYSGLLNLISLEPEFLKIDMTLVQGIDQAPLKVDIIAAIIDIASSAGILTVAEGVEREEDRNVLVSLGCDLLQGYYFCKPGPAFPTIESPLLRK